MTDKIKSLFDLSHSIIVYQGKRIVACNGHCCELHGMSEYQYLHQKNKLHKLKKDCNTK